MEQSLVERGNVPEWGWGVETAEKEVPESGV
jgi:hypothetical protein